MTTARPAQNARSGDAGTVYDRAAAREFADTHIAPYADDFDRAERMPEEPLACASRAGLWAPFLPRDAGGLGMDMVTLGAVHEEIGRGCSSMRNLLTAHGMVAWAVQRWGTAGQRERWLPQLASGDALGAFCLTEPQAGSDIRGLAAKAERSPDGWTLTGNKKWVTGGQSADVLLVFARTDRGIGAFLVPARAPGVEVVPIAGLLGARASMLADIRLRAVAVGPGALIGPDGFADGMVITGTLDFGRYSVAAGSVGIMQACLDACTAYTSRRAVRAGYLRDLQLIQAKITDMITDTAAARLLYEKAGRLKDSGDQATITATLIAKYFAAKAAARHAGEAVQIHGANGVGSEYPVARYFRDAKIMEIIEGSSEIQQITIADTAYGGISR